MGCCIKKHAKTIIPHHSFLWYFQFSFPRQMDQTTVHTICCRYIRGHSPCNFTHFSSYPYTQKSKDNSEYLIKENCSLYFVQILAVHGPCKRSDAIPWHYYNLKIGEILYYFYILSYIHPIAGLFVSIGHGVYL